MWVAIIKQLVNTIIFTVTLCFNMLCPSQSGDFIVQKEAFKFYSQFSLFQPAQKFNCSGQRQYCSVSGPMCHTNFGLKPCYMTLYRGALGLNSVATSFT